MSADVEALTWHPHDPTCFLVSAEDGLVACMDARNGAGTDYWQSREGHMGVMRWQVGPRGTWACRAVFFIWVIA